MYDCTVRLAFSTKVVTLVLACVSCGRPPAPPTRVKTETEPTHERSGVVDAAVASTDSRGDAASPAPVESVADLVGRWNSAHDRHDANALAQLYAPTVNFYDSDLPNAEVVKRKRDALAAASDYTQTLSEVEASPVDANGGVFVRFKKATTSRGHAKSYFGFLYVIGGRIVAEGDRDPLGAEVTTRYIYCYDTPSGLKINDVRVGVFKVSALEALLAIQHSKAFADFNAQNHAALTLNLRDCAHGCAPGDFGACKDGDIVDFFFVGFLGNRPVAACTVQPITKLVSCVPVAARP